MSRRTRDQVRHLAKAIVASGARAGVLDELCQGIDDWTTLVEDAPSVATTLNNPAIPKAERLRIVDEASERMNAHPAVAALVRSLVEESALGHLPHLRRDVALHRDRVEGRVRVRLHSARPLSAEHQSAIEAGLRRRLGNEPLVDYAVDEELIGGVVAVAGSFTFDGSVASRLKRIHQLLLSQALEAETHWTALDTDEVASEDGAP